MTLVNFYRLLERPYSSSAAATVRKYAERFLLSKQAWKRLTAKEEARFQHLWREVEVEMRRTDLELLSLLWRSPDDYLSRGAEFQVAVQRLVRLADELDKRVAEQPATPPPPSSPYVTKIGWVYFIRAGEFVKIGYAADVTSRLRGLETGSPVELVLLYKESGSLENEAAFHKRFAKCRHRGEWFRLEGELLDFLSRAMEGAG